MATTAEPLTSETKQDTIAPAVSASTSTSVPPKVGLPLDGRGRFGIELTFSNPHLIELARDLREDEYKIYSTKLLHDWVDEIRKRRPTLHFSDFTEDAYNYPQITVTFESGLQFFLHSDDWVFEVGASPMSSYQLATELPDVQDIIFDSAASLGLVAQARIGGGHLHIEKESHFHGDAVLFRNFLVYLANNPELFLGALSLDLLNAPPIAILPVTQQQAFIDIIADFDATTARLAADPSGATQDGRQRIEELCDAINKRVYVRSYIQNSSSSDLVFYTPKQTKYQAVNLLHAETIEIRGCRPQRSALALLTLQRLFETRIAALAEQFGQTSVPLALRDLSGVVSFSVDRNVETYNVNIEPSRIWAVFAEFAQIPAQPKCADIRDVVMVVTDELVAQFQQRAEQPGATTAQTDFSNCLTRSLVVTTMSCHGKCYTRCKQRAQKLRWRWWHIESDRPAAAEDAVSAEGGDQEPMSPGCLATLILPCGGSSTSISSSSSSSSSSATTVAAPGALDEVKIPSPEAIPAATD